MDIKYKKLHKNAVAPIKIYDVDAGFDLTAIWKKENNNYIEYGTGLAFEIPIGYVGYLFSRSSISNKDLILKNAVGVIDASYRGEIIFRFAPLVNNNIKDFLITHGNTPSYQFVWDRDNHYNIGDRCGQIIFMELPKIKLLEVEELSETERGSKGYGSTGT